MIQIYDTTLRDGTQREGISLSCADKLRIAQRLDELGVAFIEGGWPGSNPKDAEFFERARDIAVADARDRGVRLDLPRAGQPRRRRQHPGAARRADAGVHRRRQDVDAARHRRAAHDARREPAHHRGEPGVPARAGPARDLRRRALLRRLQGRLRPTRSRRCGRPCAAAPRRSCCATPTAARCRGRSREIVREREGGSSSIRSASTRTTTASAPWPTRWPPSAKAPSRCRARSTATASAAATRTCARSSPTWS